MDNEDKGWSWSNWKNKELILCVLFLLALLILWIINIEEPSNKIPTDDELYKDWNQENYTPRYDEP